MSAGFSACEDHPGCPELDEARKLRSPQGELEEDRQRAVWSPLDAEPYLGAGADGADDGPGDSRR